MRYLGGKVRQAKRIADVCEQIARSTGKTGYVEPFIGGASIFAESCRRGYSCVLGGDIEADLVSLWIAVRDGWVPPAVVDRETYERLRRDPSPTPLRAWCAYAVSYNGKRWAGYGPTASGRDYVAESVRAALKKGSALRNRNASITCCSFRELRVGTSDIVYCDPPYEGTTGYGNDFDHRDFWEWARATSIAGTPVVISEYQHPPDFTVIDFWTRAATVDSKKTAAATEVLVLHESFSRALGRPWNH